LIDAISDIAPGLILLKIGTVGGFDFRLDWDAAVSLARQCSVRNVCLSEADIQLLLCQPYQVDLSEQEQLQATIADSMHAVCILQHKSIRSRFADEHQKRLQNVIDDAVPHLAVVCVCVCCHVGDSSNTFV
jgi:hypothetical protein